MITPRQLAQRSECYHQLNQLTTAGVPIIKTLEMLSRSPPSPGMRRPLRTTAAGLESGFTFAEALRRSGTWFAAFDLALLEAAEHSGRLDAVFRMLADYYQTRAELARKLLGGIAYPAFLLHFAIFIFPFPNLFLTGNVAAYLGQTFGVLLPIYVVVLLGVFAAQGSHGEPWRAVIEGILAPIPLLGSARRSLALARLSAALEVLLGAGVTMIEAWALAAAASGSPQLKRTVRSWKSRLQSGSTPAEEVRASRKFPELFANLYGTAELSGQLEDALKRLRIYYQEEGSRQLQFLAAWTPRFAYLIVAAMIAYRVIKFWTDYFQQIKDITGGS